MVTFVYHFLAFFWSRRKWLHLLQVHLLPLQVPPLGRGAWLLPCAGGSRGLLLLGGQGEGEGGAKGEGEVEGAPLSGQCLAEFQALGCQARVGHFCCRHFGSYSESENRFTEEVFTVLVSVKQTVHSWHLALAILITGMETGFTSGIKNKGVGRGGDRIVWNTQGKSY